MVFLLANFVIHLSLFGPWSQITVFTINPIYNNLLIKKLKLVCIIIPP